MANRWFPFLSAASSRSGSSAAARPAVLKVSAAGRDVDVTIKRNPRARRYTLRLSARGDGASLTIPHRGSLSEAKAFLARHLDWLAAKLPPEAAEYLADGAIVPIHGIPHRVRASGSLRGTVKISRDGDGVATLVVPGAAESRRRRVEDHLRAVARDDLALAVDHHAASLGVRPRAIRLKDTTSRWGSASASGTLSFSWRLAMAPPFVLDYLAAHEVAHLKEMNHSERFWAICRRLAPRTDEAQAWLKAHGRELHRAI